MTSPITLAQVFMTRHLPNPGQEVVCDTPFLLTHSHTHTHVHTHTHTHSLTHTVPHISDVWLSTITHLPIHYMKGDEIISILSSQHLG